MPRPPNALNGTCTAAHHYDVLLLVSLALSSARNSRYLGLVLLETRYFLRGIVPDHLIV